MLADVRASETSVYFNETKLRRFFPKGNLSLYSGLLLGRAMAQVVSRWPLTTEARVRARVNPYGICGGQNGTGTGFSPSSSVFPCQYIIPPLLSKLISSGES
jgi:hypothetical protein